MTHRNETIWTCDRCGTEAIMPGQDQPQDWSGVAHGQPPRRDLNDSGRYHLCVDCSAALKTFLDGRA